MIPELVGPAPQGPPSSAVARRRPRPCAARDRRWPWLVATSRAQRQLPRGQPTLLGTAPGRRRPDRARPRAAAKGALSPRAVRLRTSGPCGERGKPTSLLGVVGSPCSCSASAGVVASLLPVPDGGRGPRLVPSTCNAGAIPRRCERSASSASAAYAPHDRDDDLNRPGDSGVLPCLRPPPDPGSLDPP